MTIPEIERILQGMTITIDTREQDNRRLRTRIAQMGCPTRRETLPFGDYSAAFPLPDGGELDLRGRVVIERKENLSELAQNYTHGRARFRREFERAKEAGAKVYLLVENGSWEKAMNGEYRSRFSAKAMLASLLAWQARYGCVVLFCPERIAGHLIREVLYREGKELLERMVTADGA